MKEMGKATQAASNQGSLFTYYYDAFQPNLAMYRSHEIWA